MSLKVRMPRRRRSIDQPSAPTSCAPASQSRSGVNGGAPVELVASWAHHVCALQSLVRLVLASPVGENATTEPTGGFLLGVQPETSGDHQPGSASPYAIKSSTVEKLSEHPASKVLLRGPVLRDARALAVTLHKAINAEHPRDTLSLVAYTSLARGPHMAAIDDGGASSSGGADSENELGLSQDLNHGITTLGVHAKDVSMLVRAFSCAILEPTWSGALSYPDFAAWAVGAGLVEAMGDTFHEILSEPGDTALEHAHGAEAAVGRDHDVNDHARPTPMGPLLLGPRGDSQSKQGASLGSELTRATQDDGCPSCGGPPKRRPTLVTFAPYSGPSLSRENAGLGGDDEGAVPQAYGRAKPLPTSGAGRREEPTRSLPIDFAAPQMSTLTSEDSGSPLAFGGAMQTELSVWNQLNRQLPHRVGDSTYQPGDSEDENVSCGATSFAESSSADEFAGQHKGVSPRVFSPLMSSVSSPRHSSPKFIIDFSELNFRQVIGEGAFAEVWEGEWLQSPVAIKRFRATLANTGNDNDSLAGRRTHSLIAHAAELLESNGDAGRLPRKMSGKVLQRFFTRRSGEKYKSFLEEVQVMSALRHPNLVMYMGAVVDPKNPLCIVSELFGGGSVHDYLHTSRSFVPQIRDAMHICTSVARGMNYLHSRTPVFLHRDLKPRNLLLRQHGSCSHVVICDFGMCRLFDEAGISAAETAGTVNYMSPNVAHDARTYTAADDVYSYGICMWEIFTGRQPYAGLRPMQALFQVCEGERPDITEEDEDRIPVGLIELMRACWQENPKDRPTFADILRVLKDHEAVFEARQDTGGAWRESESQDSETESDSSDMAPAVLVGGQASSSSGLPKSVVQRGQKDSNIVDAPTNNGIGRKSDAAGLGTKEVAFSLVGDSGRAKSEQQFARNAGPSEQHETMAPSVTFEHRNNENGKGSAVTHVSDSGQMDLTQHSAPQGILPFQTDSSFSRGRSKSEAFRTSRLDLYTSDEEGSVHEDDPVDEYKSEPALLDQLNGESRTSSRRLDQGDANEKGSTYAESLPGGLKKSSGNLTDLSTRSLRTLWGRDKTRGEGATQANVKRRRWWQRRRPSVVRFADE